MVPTEAIMMLILHWSTVLQAQDSEPPDLLFQPNITISYLVTGLSEGQQQDQQLFIGHNFTISCSIQPQYPGGQFSLMFNQTVTQTQQAVNHSAHFLFPAADNAHQGNYSCVYHNYVFNRTFSSESEALSVTVTDYVRLVDGHSRCTGKLELKHQGRWKPLDYTFSGWSMRSAAVLCRQLGCGSAASTKWSMSPVDRQVWGYSPIECDGTESALKACGKVVDTKASYANIEVTCSESVRLENGSDLCSGRVEVKSGQSWASLCEADFDWQDAEVVCRELGCGAPSALRGALYGEVEAPMGNKEIQCRGSESLLLDCATSDSARNIPRCKAVGLTCSAPDDVRLVGGGSRCAGTMEWNYKNTSKPFFYGNNVWVLRSAAVVCKQLGCGSAISTATDRISTRQSVWWLTMYCFGPEPMLRECGAVNDFAFTSRVNVTVVCEDLLFHPNISISSSMAGPFEGQQQGLQHLKGHNFTISCSIQPQYPGGQFSLMFNQTVTQTQQAVNHSAHFLFPAADDVHQGNYSCVYHNYVFNHNFSSESELVFLAVETSALPAFITRLVGLVSLTLTVSSTALCIRCKATRRQEPGREERTEVYYNLVGGRAEAGLREEGEHQAAESDV